LFNQVLIPGRAGVFLYATMSKHSLRFNQPVIKLVSKSCFPGEYSGPCDVQLLSPPLWLICGFYPLSGVSSSPSFISQLIGWLSWCQLLWFFLIAAVRCWDRPSYQAMVYSGLLWTTCLIQCCVGWVTDSKINNFLCVWSVCLTNHETCTEFLVSITGWEF
jgi:hypothetical protein